MWPLSIKLYTLSCHYSTLLHHWRNPVHCRPIRCPEQITKKKKKLLKIPPKKTSGACKWHFYQSHRRVENTIPRCVPPSSPSPLPLHKRSRWVPACHCGRVLASQWEAHHLNHPEETDGTDSTPVQKICRNKKAEKWQLFQSLIIIK